MSSEPLVSVVMSVYNDAETLAATLDSILTQEGVALELIVVDDGSVDGSGTMLDDYARCDERVRVIHQENTGLTRALIRGCASARGRYIARQDAGGDRSLPGRLAQQCTFLESSPEVVMISCGTRFVGPQGEFLYEIIQRGDDLQEGLTHLASHQICGPSSHPSVTFQRSAYLAAGEYRAEFRVAQDLDLWTRLAEQGSCVATPRVLYEAVWQAGSISHIRRRDQVLTTEAIVACRQRRQLGQSEEPVLEQLRAELGRTPRPPVFFPGLMQARFDYFLGSLLANQDATAASHYFRKAIIAWPLHGKAWWKMLRLYLSSSNHQEPRAPDGKTEDR